MKRPVDPLENLKKLLNRAATQKGVERAQTCYEIGIALKKLVPERHVGGDDRISELAKQAKVQQPNLYHCRQFAWRFSRQEWKQLQKLVPDITFNHVVALLSVEAPKKRAKYAKLIANERLTVKALRHRLQADRGSQRAGGRTVEPCDTPQDAWEVFVEDLRLFASRWQVRQDQIAKHFRSLPAKERRQQLGEHPASFKQAAREILKLLT